MKKVLFVIPAYNHGGTNRSLVNLLECLGNDDYNMELFCIVDSGPYKPILSKYHTLKHSKLLTAIYQKYNSIKTERMHVILWKLVIKALYRLLKAILGDIVTNFIYNRIAKRIESNMYDTIIAMQEGLSTVFTQYITAKNKIAWVRCDYRFYQQLVHADEQSIYEKYTKIICVSKYTRSIFIDFYPSLSNRCYAIYNIISTKSIIAMAKLTDKLDCRFINDTFTIVSIGRLSPFKQFNIIPVIAKELYLTGYSFRWYIIGDGEERDNISNLIKEYNMSANVILLGQKDNPYPYLLNSNILVCTSVSEAYPNVINEAKILRKPVITTNFGSAGELIDNNINGYIVKKEEIAQVLAEAISGDQNFQEIVKNTDNYEFFQGKTIETIKTII